MTRIALIRTYQPSLAEEIAHPLGIMSLDAYLRRCGYEDVHLFDMRLGRETPGEVLRRVLPLRPDVIGLSSLTPEKPIVHRLARRIKAHDGRIFTVVGGPYATGSGRAILGDPSVDFAVAGEGENTLVELLAQLPGGRPWEVPGLWYRRDGQVGFSGPRAFIPDLDDLPLPSWDRVDFQAYQRIGTIESFSGRRWATLVTSRGCPYGCTYCHDVFGKRFRPMSPRRVLEEIELLARRHGVGELLIFDDIFNLQRERVLEICDRIRASGLDLRIAFPNGVRADLLDEEVLNALKAAGTYRVNVAVETASPRLQRSLRKNLDLDRVRRIIDQLDELDLLAHGFFMLGFPGESLAEMLDTIRFACESRLHTAGFFAVNIFEGTPLGEQFLPPAGREPDVEPSYYDAPPASVLSPWQFRILRRYANLRFFLQPRRLVRLLRLLPDKRHLLRMVSEVPGRLLGIGPRGSA